MSVKIRTPNGFVTSYREAWKDNSGRTVWTWRTDGPTPHDFGTITEAQEWIDQIWWDAPIKERDEANWSIWER